MMNAPKVIAVVDDEAAIRKAIVRLLGANGFATRDYPSAEAFLGCQMARESACLVLDINLGGMSGIELQRRLNASGSPIPVVFITAVDDERTKAEAMKAGCAGFLRKPFPASALIGTIAKATQQGNATQERQSASGPKLIQINVERRFTGSPCT